MEILKHPLFLGFVVLFVLVEVLWSRARGLSNYSPYESLSNGVVIGLDRLIAAFTTDTTESSFFSVWLWNHRLLSFPDNPVIQFAVTFLAVEFAYYWAHRYNHNVALGWATHITHHSPTKYNLTLGYRLGLTKPFSLSWVLFIPLIPLGCDPKLVGLSVGIIFIYQLFLHTELVPRLGFLEKIFNSPSNHRVHHSDDPRFYNKNLGGLTMFWDHIFGTYAGEPDGGTKKYGMSELMGQRNIAHEVLVVWKLLFKKAYQTPGFMPRLRVIFGSPTALTEPARQHPDTAAEDPLQA